MWRGVALGVAGCGVLSLAANLLANEGLGGQQRDSEDLRRAVVLFDGLSPEHERSPDG
jgi:hypothetical protein